MAADSVGELSAAVQALCLLGPTGTGKTDLAIRLAGEFPVEIISVDSAMVYRHMNIGTAKPPPELRARVAHHLIDIRDPWESYSAGQFRTDAMAAIAAIRARGHMPLLVGGTMLYFRALFRGLAPLPAASPELRAAIDREAEARGWPAMHAELARVDALAAARIRPGDRQRIQRALEVFRITGQPISALQIADGQVPGMHYLRIALVPADRRALHSRLEQRLAGMIGEGLVAEVRRLRELPLMSAACPSMRAVGYRQVWQHLSGEFGLEEAQRQAAVATRRLAKRQLTWLRSEAVDMSLDPAGADVYGPVARVLEEVGVSRCGQRCNMMGPPIECREHGV